jgi:hypothetical protein
VAASSIDTTEVEMMEAEQEALADAALSEFAAAYGIDMPAGETAEDSAPPPPAAKKSEKQG